MRRRALRGWSTTLVVILLVLAGCGSTGTGEGSPSGTYSFAHSDSGEPQEYCNGKKVRHFEPIKFTVSEGKITGTYQEIFTGGIDPRYVSSPVRFSGDATVPEAGHDGLDIEIRNPKGTGQPFPASPQRSREAWTPTTACSI